METPKAAASASRKRGRPPKAPGPVTGEMPAFVVKTATDEPVELKVEPALSVLPLHEEYEAKKLDPAEELKKMVGDCEKHKHQTEWNPFANETSAAHPQQIELPEKCENHPQPREEIVYPPRELLAQVRAKLDEERQSVVIRRTQLADMVRGSLMIGAALGGMAFVLVDQILRRVL